MYVHDSCEHSQSIGIDWKHPVKVENVYIITTLFILPEATSTKDEQARFIAILQTYEIFDIQSTFNNYGNEDKFNPS